MSNTVQKVSVAAGCTALSLGLGLLDANPADASLIGDEIDYVINVGEGGVSESVIVVGSDDPEELEISFGFDGVLQGEFSEGFSEGFIDIEESTITGLIFTDGEADVFSEGFVIPHSLQFNGLNWVDSPDGRIVGAQLTLFETFSDSSSGVADVLPPVVGFTDDSVFLAFTAFADGFDSGPGTPSQVADYEIAFEITLDVEKSVPEPSSLISLAALGILGTGATLKRKSKSSKTSKHGFK